MSARPRRQPLTAKSANRKDIKTPAAVRGKTSAAVKDKLPAAVKEKKVVASQRNVVDRFPDELLLTLFSYLNASDLLLVARVCQRWLCIANDNTLWRHVSRKYLPKSARKDIAEPLDAPTQYWKRECIKRSVEWRNNRVHSKLDSADLFTLLPANIKPNLEQLGVLYTLAFLDRSGSHHYIRPNDCFYHRMSVTTRWYNLGELPPPGRLQTLKLLALNPVFYDQKGRACKNSPCQRSLLYKTQFDWSKLTSQTPLGSDSAVNLFSLGEGIVVAAWKDGGGLAFITANLHYHNLINRCLQGTFKEAHTMSSDATFSTNSVYTRLGMNDYSATVELRNQRQSIWSNQFRQLNGSTSSDGFTLAAIRPDRVSEHSPLERAIELPWKTDVFKNKTQNVCILDMCVRNTNGQLMLFCSEFVQSGPDELAKVSYDYDGPGLTIRHISGRAKVTIVIDKDPATDKQLISNLTISFA